MTSTDNFHGGVGSTAHADIAAFAAAVRSHLSDLPPDEVEELVDGLEADLIEQRADSGEPLGDPSDYADELRAAAGLPPRDARPAAGEWFGGYRRLARQITAWAQEQRSNPVVAPTLAFLVALRPAWWVLRGWVIFATVFTFGALSPLPTESSGWLLLLGIVVVSAQWGRGRWMPWAWLRVAKIVVSVMAVLALPAMLSHATYRLGAGADTMYDQVEYVPQGLSSNGMEVTNVFAYDCAGSPLSGVQLFDQNGEPLAVGAAGIDDWIITYEDGNEIALVPNPDTNPGSGWNVFPLFHGRFGNGDVAPDPATFEVPAPPFDAVQPLAGDAGTCATGAADTGGTDAAPTGPVETPAPGETPSRGPSQVPSPSSAPMEPVEP
jgi:hypothetical protein